MLFMREKLLHRLSVWPAFVLFLGLLVLVLGTSAWVTVHMLNYENQRSTHHLDLDLLAKQMEHNLRQRLEVISTLGLNKLITDVLKGVSAQDNHDVRLALNTTNEVVHSELVAVYAVNGTIVSSSNNKSISTTGFNYAFRPYVQRSRRGETVVFPAFGVVTKSRGLYLSTPVYGDDRTFPLGIVVLKIGIGEVETLLAESDDLVAVVSPEGVVFACNQPSWVYHSTKPLSPSARSQINSTRQFGLREIQPLAYDLTGEQATIGGKRYLVDKVPFPVPGWSILSCRQVLPMIPLPGLHKFLLIMTLSVTGGLAVLVFFLLANIQRRRKTESRLRRAEEKYHNIFINAAMGIFQSSLEGRYLEASPSMARILGYRNPGQLIEEVRDIGQDVYVDQLERKSLLDRLTGEEFIEDHETRFRRRDGSVIRVSLSLRFVSDFQDKKPFIEGFCLDITAKRAAEDALRREHDIVSRVMETSPLGIILTNKDKEITFANPKAEELLGLTRSPANGAEYAHPELCMTDAAGREISLDDLLITRAMPLSESSISYPRIAMTRPDGRKLHLSLNTAPLRNASGELTEAVAIFEDITGKIRAEREEALKQQHLVQVDRMMSLGILTSGVAHEINNPNTFIMSNAQLFSDAWQEARAILDSYHRENGDFLIGGLQYSKFRDRMPQLCSRILEGSVRIQRIVRELRNYSSKGPVASLGSVDINEVIRSAEILLGNMIRKSTDHFELSLVPNLPTVRGDFQRLEQVVINIVQNACQALPDPSHGIRVSTEYNSENGSVALVCRDEGIGIPENQLGHITDPFFTTKRDKGGTGLGLSISLSIVREYGGTLKFRSSPDKGTTVEVKIPAEHRAMAATRTD